MGVCFCLSCSTVLDILARATGQEKEIRGTHIAKEAVKAFLFADGMVLHMTDTKDSTRRLLELMNTFSNVAGYKINIPGLERWLRD